MAQKPKSTAIRPGVLFTYDGDFTLWDTDCSSKTSVLLGLIKHDDLCLVIAHSSLSRSTYVLTKQKCGYADLNDAFVRKL